MGISPVTPCFTPGTLIATDRGQRPIETLRRGDRIVTRDNGLVRVYWIGRRDVSFAELKRVPQLRPILIKAGAMGDAGPKHDMVVSPTHRMLVGAGSGAFPTDEPEALVSAWRLVDNRGVRPAAALGVSYIHVLCDRHQVILANGAWTESFHPDDRVMRAMGNAQRLELIDLFPEIETIGAAPRFSAARPIVDDRSRFER